MTLKIHKKMNFSGVLLALFICLYFSPGAEATPAPAMGSSLLVSGERNFFLSQQGFRLDLKGQAWQSATEDWNTLLYSLQADPKPEAKKFNYQKELKGGKTLHLSMQVYDLGKAMTLESYGKQWMKDYALLGFDLLGTRTFQQGSQRGLVMDLFEKNKKLHSRQVVFLKAKRSVLLSCYGQNLDFNRDLAECNEAIKSFQWID